MNPWAFNLKHPEAATKTCYRVTVKRTQATLFIQQLEDVFRVPERGREYRLRNVTKKRQQNKKDHIGEDPARVA